MPAPRIETQERALRAAAWRELWSLLLRAEPAEEPASGPAGESPEQPVVGQSRTVPPATERGARP